ncbi:hypothetical protein OROGR_008353 [Orobanche gracilis]
MVGKEQQGKEGGGRIQGVHYQSPQTPPWMYTFRKKAPKAIKEIRKFAQKAVGTTDVRVDVKLNKNIWIRGIRSVRRRIRVLFARNRNNDEDAKEELYSLVAVAEIPDGGFEGVRHPIPRAINVLNFPDVNGKALCIMSSHRDPSIHKSGTANICIQNSDKSKGYGFVQFESKDAAQNAVDKLNGMLINDKQAYVDHHLREQKSDSFLSREMFNNICVKDFSESSTEKKAVDKFQGVNLYVDNLDDAHDDDSLKGGFDYKLYKLGGTHVPKKKGKLFSRTITTDAASKKEFMINYTCDDRILLVGDGDFSFGMCIAILIGDTTNITVTSLESYVTSLLALGGFVLHEVYATKIYEDPRFFLRKYDKIVYNMPHAGFLDGFGEHDEIIFRKLLTGYFKSSSPMLNPNGEIHVRHHTEPPYDKWNIVELAKAEGQETPFNPRDYPSGFSAWFTGIETPWLTEAEPEVVTSIESLS